MSRSITNSSNFSYKPRDLYKHNTASVDQFVMPNSVVYMRSFITIRCRVMEIWDLKLANFYREMYARGQHLPTRIHLYLNIGKFWAQYF